MQNRFDLLDTDVLPIFMIIALDLFITTRFSINCSAVICSPTVILAIMREATSETYGPGSLSYYIASILFTSHLVYYFAIFTFQSIQQKYQKYLLYYLYQISLLRVTMKGLTTPLSDCCEVLLTIYCKATASQSFIKTRKKYSYKFTSLEEKRRDTYKKRV